MEFKAIKHILLDGDIDARDYAEQAKRAFTTSFEMHESEAAARDQEGWLVNNVLMHGSSKYALVSPRGH